MKTAILNLIARIRNAIIHALTPSTMDLLATVKTIEAKIERAINKDLNSLGELAAAELRIATAKAALNSSIDDAYRLLHNVSSLTAGK